LRQYGDEIGSYDNAMARPGRNHAVTMPDHSRGRRLTSITGLSMTACHNRRASFHISIYRYVEALLFAHSHPTKHQMVATKVREADPVPMRLAGGAAGLEAAN